MTNSTSTTLDSRVPQDEAFWVDRLAQQTTVEIPYGRPGHAATESAGMGVLEVLGVTETDALRANCSVELPPSDLLTAAFLIWLARLSGSYTFDVGFSYGLLRREATKTGHAVSSHVPLHVGLDPMGDFERAVELLRQELEVIRQHGTFARDVLHRHPELSLRPTADGSPSWSIVVEQAEAFDGYTPLTDSDLTVLCAEDGQEMRWIYDRARLSAEDVAALRHRFVTFLNNVMPESHRAISAVSVLTDSEYHQLIVEWNDTHVDYPRDRCIHLLFEAQARRIPDHTAAVFEQERLTYADLNRRANRLAHWLRAQGVGPNVHVGIAVQRSFEMLIGLHAIMKAGGVYVPLEPSYPSERIADILKDADISIVLTQAHIHHLLPTDDVRAVCLDTDWNALTADQSVENPECRTTLEDLAYTIYTSGSTGKPKGVMNTHGGILNRLLWMQDVFGLTRSDRILHKTPFSFDVSVWELFWPFMYGATLIIARPEGHKDNEYLVGAIMEQQITLMHFVPSMLQLFLQARGVRECHSLRHVVCSGEALPADLRDRFFRLLDARLHNLYGPTEAAVDVTRWECRRDDTSSVVPIGRPVANTQMYILDRFMQPVPVGLAGELEIGGVQVARGYLNRPELTAERFVPDPFRDDPRARLYRTGDLARYLPDGNIEYLGRLDHQVKLQGFRIELGEIESVLSRHPAVREAVVVVHGDTAGEKRLVAYLVSETGSPLSDRPLRDYLRKRLPDHMVPSAFMWVAALPLTSNGKVDRRRLPAPMGQRSLEQAYQAPCSETEKKVVDIWRDVLKVDKVGIEDNFFELGGNSFLSILAATQMHEALDIDVPVTMLFQHPTVKSLVRCLQATGEDQRAPHAIGERALRRKTALSRRRVVR